MDRFNIESTPRTFRLPGLLRGREAGQLGGCAKVKKKKKVFVATRHGLNRLTNMEALSDSAWTPAESTGHDSLTGELAMVAYPGSPRPSAQEYAYPAVRISDLFEEKQLCVAFHTLFFYKKTGERRDASACAKTRRARDSSCTRVFCTVRPLSADRRTSTRADVLRGRTR